MTTADCGLCVPPRPWFVVGDGLFIVEIVTMDSVFLDIIVAAEARVAGSHAANSAGEAA